MKYCQCGNRSYQRLDRCYKCFVGYNEQKKCLDCSNKRHLGRNRCKECYNKTRKSFAKPNSRKSKNNQLKYRFGITLVYAERMLADQGHTCKICRREIEFGFEKKVPRHRLACIDHCHNTGKVRDIICHNCNAALGLVKDNKTTLTNMIKYLNAHESSTTLRSAPHVGGDKVWSSGRPEELSRNDSALARE
jgi:hypothetical protein